MTRAPRNVAASVHARLLNRSRERGEDFNFLLQRYAAERFLYRLGESRHRDRYVLKGAMLFALWGGSAYRPTRDLDFTGYGTSESDAVLACFREICALSAPDDGLVFDATTLAAESIRDDAEYDGLRVKFVARLGAARIDMQVDVGFGNAIEPAAAEVKYPTLLDAPSPRILAYPHEAVVAEKLHCMVLFGERNSRLKDFYDLYVLAREFRFDGARLASAIAATFQRRDTPIEAARPAALAPRLYSDAARAGQWRTYLGRNRLPGAPADFDAVGELLRRFLGPAWDALASGVGFRSTWRPGEAWGAEEDGATGTRTPSETTRDVAPAPRAVRADGELVAASIEDPAAVPLRRFTEYPKYKDSGVEWLGEIPAHWECLALARVTVSRCDGPFGSGLKSEHYSGDGVRVVRLQNIGWAKFSDGDRAFIDEVYAGELGDHDVVGGDLLIAGLGDEGHPVGRACAAPRGVEPAMVKADCFRFRLDRSRLHSDFAAYQLSATAAASAGSLATGATRSRMNLTTTAARKVALPPSDEQRGITAFLDRETARIDALVAKKERLIELLQEKRTALITRAVTKGLDPDVPMKDSGIEWLGEIPAHWEVKRLWHLTPADRRIMYGIVLPGPNVNYGVPIVKGGDVSPARLRLDRLNRTTREIESGYVRSRLRGGDLVYAIRGSIGEVAMVPDELEGANLTQDAARVAYTLATCGPWLLYALKSVAVFAQLEAGALGATIRGINIRDLKRASIAIPSHGEQRAIASFLDQETPKLDTLIAKVREAIERLKELRAALISAAVTGKIDVREEAG